MPLDKNAVGRLIKKAAELFNIPRDHDDGVPTLTDRVQLSGAGEDERPAKKSERRGARHTRRCAETEIVLARHPWKGGFFKVFPGDDEKIVFNVWISPLGENGEPKYKDRLGNPRRILFPKVFYRGKKVVARIPFSRERGPSLPIGLLYGRPCSPSFFTRQGNEGLELFAEGILQGVARYDAERNERRRARKSA